MEGFDPRELPGLEAWYDVSAISGFGSAAPAEAASIASWTDLSGKGKHLVQATGGQQPAYRSANWNMLSAPLTTGLVISASGLAAVTAPSSQGIISNPTLPINSLPAVRFTANGTGTGGYFTNAFIPALPGVTYTAIAYGRASAATFCYTGIYFYNSSKVEITHNFAGLTSVNTSLTGPFTPYTMTATSPAGTAYVRMITYIPAATPAGTIVDMTGLQLGVGTIPATMPYLPQNNPAGIQFDGVNDLLSVAGVVCPTEVSVYAVVLENTPVASNGRWLRGQLPTPATSGWALATNNATPEFRFFSYDNASNPMGSGGTGKTPVGTSIIAGGVGQAANSQWNNHNGSAGVVTPSQSAAWGGLASAGSTLTMGADAAGTSPSSSLISAALVFSRNHDLATRRRVITGLSTKYGITLTRP